MAGQHSHGLIVIRVARIRETRGNSGPAFRLDHTEIYKRPVAIILHRRDVHARCAPGILICAIRVNRITTTG